MEELNDDSLMYRFLNRETTEEENKEILDWISASEENRDRFRKIHQAFNVHQYISLRSKTDLDQAWEKLYTRLTDGRKKLIPRIAVYFIKVAAAILVLLAVGLGSIWVVGHFLKQDQQAMIMLDVPKGEKTKIVLTDGTLIWVNSQSTLRYNALDPRKVTIEGEAYFEVCKNVKQPFEVSTASGMKLRVTGTRFNLRCYPNERFVETTLEEGCVIIENIHPHPNVVLNPGEQARFDPSVNQVDVRKVVPEIYSLWKNNELRFENIPFSDLIPRIERIYGVNIQMDPRMNNNDRFTMTIATESLRELFNMMKLTSKFDYEINGEQVKIHAR
jgi:ferric-dicitrate binding protein FerR (iron transport regulator)